MVAGGVGAALGDGDTDGGVVVPRELFGRG